MTYAIEEAKRRWRVRKRWIAAALTAAWIGTGAWHVYKPMPPGTDVASVARPSGDVRFLRDLTRPDPHGRPIIEQQIFDEVFAIIDDAHTFVVLDFFLLNESMGEAPAQARSLSRELVDHLIARKRSIPELQTLVITDPINEVYGGTRSPLFAELEQAGIEVVRTNLSALRDSNPAYSAWWRMFVQWWGNSPDGGSLDNPFSAEGQPITVRSWLALLNFKANHRKLIVADRNDGQVVALVTSANPHDASSAHSNVALRFEGRLALDILVSELAVARLSGWSGHIHSPAPLDLPDITGEQTSLQFLTEESIRDHLLDAFRRTRNGDCIRVATFYLADRAIIEALLDAAERNVQVRLILDPNRDAFGRQKDGVPNRPVANELVAESGERIAVRWYRTRGEQFHTKLALVTLGDRLIVSLGSANLTRRNLGNYNLEANLAADLSHDSALALQLTSYFDRLWNNEGAPGTEYTDPFGAYRDDDRTRYWRYRIMEATGLSTF